MRRSEVSLEPPDQVARSRHSCTCRSTCAEEPHDPRRSQRKGAQEGRNIHMLLIMARKTDGKSSRRRSVDLETTFRPTGSAPVHPLVTTSSPNRHQDSPKDAHTRPLQTGYYLKKSMQISGEGGFAHLAPQAAVLASPPARLRPLVTRQSKGTVALTLAPSRARNPPRPGW